MRVPIEDVTNLILDLEEVRLSMEASAHGLRAIQERLARTLAKYGTDRMVQGVSKQVFDRDDS